MVTKIAEDLYHQAMAVNQKAFDVGLYNGAYHALMSALYFAEYISIDEPLQRISQTATKQLAWIDTHHPKYEHSTQSATKRNQPTSIYANLARQADAILKM